MIFVTGGTGLVGSHLIFKLLKKGKKVAALTRTDDVPDHFKNLRKHYKVSESEIQNLKWVQGELNNIFEIFDSIGNVEEIYHCAAMVSFHPKMAKELMKTNVEGTANMVDFAIEKKVKKFCYVSSTSALGDALPGNDVVESDDWTETENRSNYSKSKYYSELEVWRGSEEGLNVCIVNPAIIIGPGKWGKSSTSIFRMVWNGLKIYSPGANAYVDVRDVVQIMIELMEKEVFNEKFLVLSENMSFRKCFDLIAKYLKKPLPHKPVSKWQAQLAWRVEAIKAVILGSKIRLTKEMVKSAFNTTTYSNQKVRQELGYSFIPVEESIEETAKLFLMDNK